MSKSVKNLSPHEKEIVLEALYQSAKRLDGGNSAVTFIDELLTESEKVTIGRRILIAQMILSGKNQAEVRSALSVSPNTFTRTRKWLNGQIPQYDKALKEFSKLQEIKTTSVRKSHKNHSDFTKFSTLRKKFPAHFLFFNIAEELLIRLHK